MKRNSFRDLEAYKESKELVKEVYGLLWKFCGFYNIKYC